MAKDNINQEITRKNILELRKKHGYTQAKVASLMGGSRTIYNGIENGKVKITEYYVQTLANIYNVPFESIAVFASGYDEGFYQGMRAKEKLAQSEFDSESMKIYHIGKELLSGKQYTSTLYPALKAMGYTVEVMSIEDCDSVKIPPEVMATVNDGKVFVLKKGNRQVGYWSPNDFYNFERFIATSIKGYIKEIADSSKKAGQNPSDIRICFHKDKKIVGKSNTKFRRTKNSYKHSLVEQRSKEEKYSANKQFNELKRDLKTFGIKEDDDSDE
jgi:transcriptional regulator with XRE-family HTH domain